MKYLYLALLLIICANAAFCQSQMRPIDELINTQEPGWAIVNKWIANAKNKVEVLSCDSAQARDALFKTQVTTRSPMGAIIYSTGGILIENGWIRILGSGNAKLNRSLPEWNKGKSFKNYGDKPSFLLIADDAIGGFFAINAGEFSEDNIGKVFYWAPDNLDWESLDLSYTEFLNFCFSGSLNEFYENLRWKGWQNDLATLDGNQVFSFFPYLYTKEGNDINKDTRKIVPIEEQYDFNISMLKQLEKSKE